MDGGERGESLTDELAAHCTLLFCPSSLPSVPLKRTDGRSLRSLLTLRSSDGRTKDQVMSHNARECVSYSAPDVALLSEYYGTEYQVGSSERTRGGPVRHQEQQ